VPALSVDGWRFPHVLGPGDRLRATFAAGALPAGCDTEGLLAATEVADTLLAPTASGGRAVVGGRWAPLHPPAHASRGEAIAWAVNGLLFVGAALALLDMLLVSSEVGWSASTSRAFGFSLLHSLLTQDGAKVAIVTLVSAGLIPFQQGKGRAAKGCRRLLHGVSNALQGVL
jgi:hypothetical protein